MSKRWLSLLLALIMVISALPVYSLAAEAEDPVTELTDQAEETAGEEALPEEEAPAEEEEALPGEETPAEEEEALPEEEAEDQASEEAMMNTDHAISIQVNDVIRFDCDRFDCYELGSNTPWSKLDCFPDYATVSVDGVTYEGVRNAGTEWESRGDLNDVRDEIRAKFPDTDVDVYWDSDEQKDAPWSGSGNKTAEVIVRIGDQEVSQSYNVTMVAAPFDRIVVAPVDVYMSEVEQGHDGGGDYSHIPVYPDTITLYNGTQVLRSGKVDEVEKALREQYGANCPRIHADSENPKSYTGYSIGDVVDATFAFCGVRSTYQVTIIDPPFDSVTVNLTDNSINRTENDRQYGWIDCWPQGCTVTLTKAGQEDVTLALDYDEHGVSPLRAYLEDTLGIQDPDIHCGSDEQESGPWSTGNGGKAWMVICGVKSNTYMVNMVEPPFDSVTVNLTDNSINRTENDRRDGWIDCWPQDSTVTLTKAGQEVATLALDYDENGVSPLRAYLEDTLGIQDPDIRWESDEQESGPWSTGNGGKAWLMVCGVQSNTYMVNMVDAPFDEVELTPPEGGITRLETEKRDDGTYDCWPGGSTVTLYKKGQEVYTGPIDHPDNIQQSADCCLQHWLENHADSVDIHWETYEGTAAYWGTGTHQAWLVVNGVRSEFDVEVKPIVTKVDVASFSVPIEKYTDNGWGVADKQNPYVNRSYQSSIVPASITVHTYDGNTFSGTLAQVKEWLKSEYGLDTDVSCYHDPLWGTKPAKICAYVQFDNYEFNYAVTLKYKTITAPSAKTVYAAKTVSVKTTGGSVTYTSSNTKVATVNKTTGVVTGVAPGTATITIKDVGGGNYAAKTVTVKVTVKWQYANPTLSKVQNVNGGMKVTFKKPSGAAAVRVFCKTGSSTSWKAVGWSTGTTFTTKYSDLAKKTPLKAGTKYTFTVRCVTKSGSSTYTSGYNTGGIAMAYCPAIAASKVTSSKAKTAVVSWSKKAGVTGYEIQYSLDKSFKSGVTTKRVAGAAKTSLTIGSLKSGKTYYVRMCTYKTLTVSGKAKTYRSVWGAAKTVKIK